jgi:hypothetical protein
MVGSINLLTNNEIPISEELIQKTIMQWVRTQKKISGLVFHIPNEGKRSLSYGKKLKDLGLRQGVSDLFIAMPNHTFCGAWIEVKTKKGKLSFYQEKFLIDMKSQNYFTSVCRSIEEGIQTIKWYCGI